MEEEKKELILTDEELRQIKTQYNKAKDLLEKIISLNVRYDAAFKAFEIRNTDEIKELIRQKALNSKQGDSSWLSKIKGCYSAFGNSKDLVFKADDFFIIPSEYKILNDKYIEETQKIKLQISELLIEKDTLVTRIQLASDKILDKMINEVDDMGDISLIHTKLKYLSN